MPLLWDAAQAAHAEVSALQALADKQTRSLTRVSASRAATEEELASVRAQLEDTVRSHAPDATAI